MSPRSLLLALVLLCVARPAAAETPPLPYWHVSLGPSVVGFEVRDGNSSDSPRYTDVAYGASLGVQLMGRISDHFAVHGLGFYDLGAGSHEDALASGRHSGLGAGLTFLDADAALVVSGSLWIGNASFGEKEVYGNFMLVGYEVRATYRWPRAPLGSGIVLAGRNAVTIDDHGIIGTLSATLGYSMSFR